MITVLQQTARRLATDYGAQLAAPQGPADRELEAALERVAERHRRRCATCASAQMTIDDAPQGQKGRG